MQQILMIKKMSLLMGIVRLILIILVMSIIKIIKMIIEINNNINDGFNAKSIEKKNVVQRFNKTNPNEINGRSKRRNQREY